jgi:hypothetical protein
MLESYTSLQKAWGFKQQPTWKSLFEQAIQAAIQESPFKNYDELYRFFAKKRKEIAEKLGQYEFRKIGYLWPPQYERVCLYGDIRCDNLVTQKESIFTPMLSGGRYDDFLSDLISRVTKLTNKGTEELLDFGQCTVYSSCDEARTRIYISQDSSMTTLFIKHPPGTLYLERLPELNQLFEEFMCQHNPDICKLAKLVWLSCDNTACDRGSASITEMILAYISAVKQINLNYINLIPLDLEAIFSSQEIFTQEFLTYFRPLNTNLGNTF